MLLEALVAIVFALVYYRTGRLERAPGLLWAALSTTASLLALALLGWGVWGVIGLNVLLFVGITVFRVVRAT